MKDCAKWYSGGTPSKGVASYWGGDIPWISSKSLTSFFVSDSEDRVTNEGAHNGTRLVPKDSILFVVRGMSLKTEFRMGIATRPVTFNQDVKALLAINDVLPAYLAYAIKSKTNEILQMVGEAGHGTGVLPTDRIQSLEIPIPPIADQRAIARILGNLDERIELNQRMDQTLEAMVRALFKSWFVDFDGVASEDMQESELGLIPKGWRVASFGDLLESSIGGDWGKEKPEDDHNEPVIIIRRTDFFDIKSGGKGGAPTRYTTAKKMASRNLQEGDIIIEISGGSPVQPTGRSMRISRSILARFESPVVCASFCRRFRPVSLSVGVLVACHLNYLYENGGTWEYQNQSTGIANFQTSHFLKVEKVVIPPDEQLKEFVTLVSPILDSMSTNQNLMLTQLRDTLLPKLLSGELRVKDAERMAETV
nr:restriction endonuclease subunit S [Xanthomonas nasturtii]